MVPIHVHKQRKLSMNRIEETFNLQPSTFNLQTLNHER